MKIPTSFPSLLKSRQSMSAGRIDLNTFTLIVALSVLGILMVYNSSIAIAMREFNDPLHFAREQGRFFIVGFILLLVISRINYRFWYSIAFPMLMGTVALLIIVFIPGIGIRALGASRWINLGFTTLQPAELAKLSLIVYLSAWFSVKESKRFIAFLMLVGMVVGLILLEPDLGTSIIVMSIALFLYFISGQPWLDLALFFPVLLLGGSMYAFSSSYRMNRLLTFVNPSHDPLGASYQIQQALIAIGSGGIFGVGFGKSRQKYEYLPESNTDSIFAILSEELGYLGAVVVIAAFILFVSRGFRIARRAPDTFGKLLASGITVWIGVQSALNIAAISGLLPLTGIPLPFISYGGSNLIVTMMACGILLNISKYGRA